MSEILTLAITMMVGPQIITAVILITSKNAVRASLAYACGVALATTIGTLVFYLFAQLFNLSESGSGEPSQLALWIQTGLVALLAGLSIKTFLNREKIELPSWLKSLQMASPNMAFKTALKLIFLMPSDIIIMSTVDINLTSQSENAIKLLPFVALTTLIASLPLLAYLVFQKRAIKVMPKVRDWMESNSWVVSIVAYIIFIYLLWP